MKAIQAIDKRTLFVRLKSSNESIDIKRCVG